MLARPCGFSSELAPRTQCFDYYTQTDGSGFQLPVVVIKNIAASLQPPVLYLPGGPGTSAITAQNSVEQWLYWLDSSGLKSDFILFDIRGTSPGKPSWQCAEYETLSVESLKQVLTLSQEIILIQPVLDECLKRFDHQLVKVSDRGVTAAVGEGIASINTPSFALDAKNILLNLGYQSWFLLGSSYGTRLAMHMAATQVEVKKMVLDAVYPPGVGTTDDAVAVWSSAFENLFKMYETHTLEFKFWQIMKQLRERPISVQVESWTTGATIQWVLTDFRFAWVIYQGMYSAEDFPRIKDAILNWGDTDNSALADLLESFYNNAFDPDFNSMVYTATECNDNGPTNLEKLQIAIAKFPQWRDYFTEDEQYDICKHSVFAKAKPLKPEKWAQPTLIASGDLDPITNTRYAQIARQLGGEARVLSLSNFSHAEFIGSECGEALIAEFFNGGELDQVLDAGQRSDYCRLEH